MIKNGFLYRGQVENHLIKLIGNHGITVVFIVKWATFKRTTGEELRGCRGTATWWSHTRGGPSQHQSCPLFHCRRIVLAAARELSCKPEGHGNLAELHALQMLNELSHQSLKKL